MRKEAIGIAINGREVKIAHVYRDKYRLGVDYLESGLFATDIDAELKSKEKQPLENEQFDQEEDLFAAKTPYAGRTPLEKPGGARDNVDILFSLLSKFGARKTKVAFNISPTLVTYQDLDTHLDYNKNVFKSNLKKKIETWKRGFNALENVSVITRRDGTLCNVFCENSNPPILELLENLNNFFKGNFFLALMDSNEVSLVNLARAGYDFSDPSQITAIVQIETEFSRIIFMKGEDILTVSPIINESFNPEINNIIYSKIIYEQDNLNLPDITNILLAGRASSITAKSFFEKKFPGAKVGFIIAQPLAETLSTQYSREDLSTFAIPISLAWKVVDSNNSNFLRTNLLPTQFIERQKVLTLSLVGFLLLVLLGLTTFYITWQITSKKIELRRLRRETVSLQEQINSSESTVNRVYEIEAEIAQLKKHIVQSDSLSAGSDQLMLFLEKLNQGVQRINSIWVEELSNTPSGVLVKGIALKRNDVPWLAEELGGAKIIKLIRNGGNGQGFAFEMEANWPKSTSPSSIPNPSEPSLSPRINQTVSAEPKPLPFRLGESETNLAANNSAVAQKKLEQSGLNPLERSVPATNPSPEPLKESQAGEISHETNTSKMTALGSNPSAASLAEAPSRSVLSAGENELGFAKAVARAAGANAQYTIQISAHANQFTANKEVEALRARGFEAYVTKLPQSNRLIPYWVCLGHYSSHDEAQQQLDQLNRVVPGEHAIVPLSNGGSSQRLAMPAVQKTVSSASAESTPAITNLTHQELGPAPAASQQDQYALAPEAGKFVIRISAHVTPFTANKEVEYYRAHGYQTYVTRLPNSSPDIPYWVCLGYFDSYAEASNKIKELLQNIPRNYDVIQLK